MEVKLTDPMHVRLEADIYEDIKREHDETGIKVSALIRRDLRRGRRSISVPAGLSKSKSESSNTQADGEAVA